jgi:hypothetical protein
VNRNRLFLHLVAPDVSFFVDEHSARIQNDFIRQTLPPLFYNYLFIFFDRQIKLFNLIR